jgi:hypothetical protein
MKLRMSSEWLRVWQKDLGSVDVFLLRLRGHSIVNSGKELLENRGERTFWTRDISKPYGDRDFKDFKMCFNPYFPTVVYAPAKGTYVWNFAASRG